MDTTFFHHYYSPTPSAQQLTLPKSSLNPCPNDLSVLLMLLPSEFPSTLLVTTHPWELKLPLPLPSASSIPFFFFFPPSFLSIDSTLISRGIFSEFWRFNHLRTQFFNCSVGPYLSISTDQVCHCQQMRPTCATHCLPIKFS